MMPEFASDVPGVKVMYEVDRNCRLTCKTSTLTAFILIMSVMSAYEICG